MLALACGNHSGEIVGRERVDQIRIPAQKARKQRPDGGEGSGRVVVMSQWSVVVDWQRSSEQFKGLLDLGAFGICNEQGLPQGIG